MADDVFVQSAIEHAMQDYSVAMADAQAELARARLNGDAPAMAKAGETMAALRVQANEFRAMAQEHFAAEAAKPEPNRFGLTPEQQDAARTCGVTDEQYAEGIRAATRDGRFSWQQRSR